MQEPSGTCTKFQPNDAYPLDLPIKLIGELSAFSKHKAVLPDVSPVCT